MASEKLFVDTSAFYALMDRSDNHHEAAAEIWASILGSDCHLYTANNIVVETMALLQNRMGFEAANLWYRDVLSLAEIIWISAAAHDLSYELWLGLGRSKLSFVDCVSFVAMRQHHIENVFGFDRHFQEQGFEVVTPHFPPA